ncbi:exonuclease SbcCD subunit D [Candidatus Dependentiae bacterium]|nr:exonuclease SbcCD subunit D [Candidatus Dependentiae bacterium]MBU4387182.1 exonuclease SbcCD subunit D [Candidatus Dependentiae bacterium]MCG2755997.1 exonuclease SbcCD subunit D [Candidatus Dependentiae bacterium]
MIKFFHTADIHLGVENYGKIDIKTGNHSRLLDFRDSLKNIVDAAIKEKIDFFLFCGDAYKTAFPTPTQQKLFMIELFRLQEAGIPVISVVGNHDHPLSFGKSNSLDVLDYLPLNGLHVFSKPGILKLETKSGPIQIVGIPWPTRNNLITDKNFHLKNYKEITDYLSKAVYEIILNLSEQLDKNIPAILAGHLTVSSGIFSGSEKCAIFGNDPMFLPSQLALNCFDYVALGHLHRFQNLNSHGYPAVVYSGSIERIDFGERKEEKGFCKVFIDEKLDDKRCSFEFVKLKIRSMIQIEVELNDNSDYTEQIVENIKRHDIQDAIIKIVYHVPDGKKDNVDLQVIQAACQSAISLASIVPVRKNIKRDLRTELNVDMNLDMLLDKYLETKNISGQQKDNLVAKAKELYLEFNSKQAEQSQEKI